MTNEILELFGRALKTNNQKHFGSVNKTTVLHGYSVHADVCSDEVRQWVVSKQIDYNSTFYKKWISVIQKNRFELFLDQIQHYLSTYGTDYTGEPYIPETVDTSEIPQLTSLKVILPISKQEVIKRCENMLFSGIALEQETLNRIFVILDGLNHTVDIDKVKNKEAKMFIHERTGTLPTDATEMVRYLVYLATKKTLLIKNKEVIDLIKVSKPEITQIVQQFGVEKLSSVFNRYKPILLAFKNTNNKTVINQLRRLSVKNHVPNKKTYIETLLSEQKDLTKLPQKLKKINNFKKISLLQTIRIRLTSLNVRVFPIRNQKVFIKIESLVSNFEYLNQVYNIVYADLVNCLKHKATNIKLPVGIDIKAPTSEKSFMGNYPLGTSFDFSNADNIIGINWKDVDGAHDLDLSLLTIDGTKYGWNSHYTNEGNSVVYSGDVTSANPEATELIYTSNNFISSIVNVNLFNGKIGSTFKFFIATEKIKNMHGNYMVNPNNVLFTVDCKMDSKQKSLGVVTQGKFILLPFRTGNGRVSVGNTVTTSHIDYTIKTLNCYVSLPKLLKDAGFLFVTDDTAQIDLTNLSKDTLIDLLN